MGGLKIFIVDDSAVVRQVLTQILATDRELQVIGAAADAAFAAERLTRLSPDIVVLDVDAPRSNGMAFLKTLAVDRRIAVVAFVSGGADAERQALAGGAACVFRKPETGFKEFLHCNAAELVGAVKKAAGRTVAPARATAARSSAAIAPARAERAVAVKGPDVVVAIGTSTGGTKALEAVLPALPADCPGIVIVQHMPETFTALFAERLDSICQIEVREAKHGDRVQPGLALVAPGGRHMTLQRGLGHFKVEVRDGPLVNRHRPSVDMLFASVAKTAGAKALGVIMTGMGDDGAKGMQAMHQAGALTIAEHESSCIVFGMPKEAIRLGGVDRIIPLPQIAGEIMAYGRERQMA
ncbi:MAG TPA: chemotaxis response regulator protein-glutamate methylesterase [Rhodocyclaceae bacterium]|nr:chemotaxis response regulator protein-glutamate methylesterase [Rhodocyclaceae bacterium]